MVFCLVERGEERIGEDRRGEGVLYMTEHHFRFKISDFRFQISDSGLEKVKGK
jgi:hypothetical protein